MKELSLTEKKKAMSMDKIVHDSLHYFEENGITIPPLKCSARKQ